ncbi:peptidase C39 family protein [Candidatus Woesearchaeota archaeon]|nr:peptidase C39 family protein [Candidatus Woesearchaeota archaeon]
MEPYRQTTPHTCAASSLLMALHHHDPDTPLTREQEFAIWHASANLPVRASSIYGLACVAKRRGLNPRIVLEEKEYDYPDYQARGYTKRDIDEAKFSSRMHHREARELGIPVEQREVTIDEVRKTLAQGKVVLLRVNAGVLRGTKSTSKYVVAYQDEDEDTFTVIDPKHGSFEVDDRKLEEAMATLQAEKKRDVRMLVFD